MAKLNWGLRGDHPEQVDAPPADPLGMDVSAFPSLGKRFRLVSGVENVGQALARRLGTPRGALHYAPDYGTDLRQFINESFTTGTLYRVQAAIEAECRKDPRVASVSARAAFDAAAEKLTVEVGVETVAGPLDLVLSVNRLTVEILEGEQ